MSLVRLTIIVLAFATACFGLDRNAFTFVSYDLDVRITTEANALDARGKILLRNDSVTPQKTLTLQISSSLTWRSVMLGGAPQPFDQKAYTSDVDHTGALSEAVVSLAEPIPPKGTVEFDISYGGPITFNATRLTRIGAPDAVTKRNEWDQITPAFSAVRGIGYVAWYPISTESANLSEGNTYAVAVGSWKLRHEESRMRVRFTTDNARAVMMNAACTDSQCEAQRIGFTVPSFIVGDFVEFDHPPFKVYHQKSPARREAATQLLFRADRVVPVVSDWFGAARSPVVVFDLGPDARTDFDAGNAVFSNLSSEGADAFVPIALARTAVDSPRLWIREGLAEFARTLWVERSSGRQATNIYLQNVARSLAEAEKQAQGTQSLVNSVDPVFYSIKAMFFWRMLRDVVGDRALQTAVRAYRSGEDREPSYMQRLVQNNARNRDLEWFFGDWVYRDRGLPEFRIEAAFARPLLTTEEKDAAHAVAVTVVNDGDAGADVPVIVRTDKGDAQGRVEVRARSKAVARISVPSDPAQATVNDGSVPESNASNNTFAIQK